MSVVDCAELNFADKSKIAAQIEADSSQFPKLAVAEACGSGPRYWRKLVSNPNSPAALRFMAALDEHIRKKVTFPWSVDVETQLSQIRKMLNGKSTSEIKRAYCFSAIQAYDHVIKIDDRARPLSNLTEVDWGQARFAGRYYSILAASSEATAEDVKRHEFVQAVLGDMLATRDDAWAYCMRVRLVVNACAPHWNRTPPEQRNSPELRAMIRDISYFEVLIGYLRFWQRDSDILFGVIAVASRFALADTLAEIENAVTPKDKPAKAGLAFMQKVVIANRRFDNGDCDFFRIWAEERWTRGYR